MCPGKPLHPKLVFLMMEQLCSALDAAHREHIVHRDLKPPNIFLIERDKNPCFVKILDFGIAKPITEESKALTRHILGTPHYMSPEQCLNDPVDARSDLYALGMLFYHMSTGTHPYKGLKAGSDFAVMQAQISQEPTPMREKRPDISLSSPVVYGRVVAFKSQDRYLYGISTRTHKRRWRVRLGLSWAGAAPIPAGRFLLIGTLRGGVWAIK